MPTFKLLLSADLENVEKLYVTDDVRYFVKFECNNCHEQTDWVYVSPEEEVEVTRSTVNFQLKCKMCGRAHTADILKGSQKEYLSQHSGSPHPLVSLDCRG
eukprot:CAMPEP_0184357322 /NCGR_PEP_ID=MMETSP1089-20130417/108205_1 /TAXON_ID=38269 ORGANISM="Gloeochaete wittrockiana, Strain SAG46.84" /NCGR_SAMPLE_ID=MMETSP1089 /ASSEMBLY_ACC=CAM_ASM_000445 /LENGTH=100 /DNA_ID=CAMNT_0026695037 /DNA_START=55 /DNA_END=353 /DNA_ORIENTATION=-